MHISKHTDWLSITFPTDTQMSGIFPLLDWRYAGKGMHGYKFKYRDNVTGAIYQEGSGNDDMGVHLTLSGDTLNTLRSAYGGVDDAIIGTLAHYNGYASRIDLTLNIHEGELTPRKVYDAVKNGSLKSKTNTYRFIEGSKGNVEGDTLYLGSPRSDRQFRCYNKSAELGIVDHAAWLRLELELRGLRANSAFKSCTVNPVSSVVTGHMEGFLSWSHREYQVALGSEAVEPELIERKASNRERWLTGQVAQALAKEMMVNPGIKETFDKAVTNFLQQYNAT